MIEKITKKQEVNDHNPPLGVRGYKHVFIDLDDTLWDFHANARLSLQDMYVDRNLSQFFENFDEFFTIYAKHQKECKNFSSIKFI